MSDRGYSVVKANTSHCLTIENIDKPEISSREVLIKPLLVGICGSDFRIYSNQKNHVPGVLGHELAGEVVEVGNEVKGFSKGDLVTINPVDCTDDSDIIGYNGSGFLASYFVADECVLNQQRLFRFNDTVVKENAVFAEQLACCVHAQSKIKHLYNNDPLVVIGSGSFGILHFLLAQYWGATNSYLSARSSNRLDAAVEKDIVSSDKVFSITEDGYAQKRSDLYGSVGTVIVTANGIDPIKEAVKMMKDDGVLLLFGGLEKGDEWNGVAFNELRRNQAFEKIALEGKEITVVGSYGTSNDDFIESVNIINDNTIDFSKMISHSIDAHELIGVMPDYGKGSINNKPILKLVTSFV